MRPTATALLSGRGGNGTSCTYSVQQHAALPCNTVEMYAHRCCSSKVVDKQQSQLCDHVHQAIFLADLHCHRKIVLKFRWEEQLCILLERWSACSNQSSKLRDESIEHNANHTRSWHLPVMNIFLGPDVYRSCKVRTCWCAKLDDV